MTPQRRAALVKERARALGFDACGVADLSPVPHRDALLKWLRDGMAGTMAYMHRQAERRLEPARIVEGANRAIVITRGYFAPDPPPEPEMGYVAKYARGRDYHNALAGPLEKLATFVRSLDDQDVVAKAFVDAGPVPERELAQRAGIGWIGKNTMLIAPGVGSHFFLATILTDLDIAPDPPFEADRCGTCRRCIEACPTGAFPEERVLDSRLCISYLTIEYGGEIEPSLAKRMGSWVFGCDVCQDVCPWNIKFAAVASDPILELDPTLARLELDALAGISAGEFERKLAWTPLERPGVRGLRRNARIALANNASSSGCPAQ